MFLLVGDDLNLQVSSSFREGARTYALPSPDITIYASTYVNGQTYEQLSVASGSITVATAKNRRARRLGQRDPH